MAAINDLIARIQDPELRKRIETEVKDWAKQKEFGLVFEKHEPEMTLLYDYPISRGCKVISKSDDDKKLSEDILWEVKKISKGRATCVHSVTKEEQSISINDLICVAKNGEPIYPCLKFVDSVQNAQDSDSWHTLIEADNYQALQLLAYLYPGKVDCIYIDPPYNSGARDWKYNNDYVDSQDKYPHSKWLAMMESRLILAKKLLNPKDSVLIVTIDEKEYLHLGCLLEQMFKDARIQMVSSVINSAGVAKQGKFSRTNEFLFFIMIGNSVPTSLKLSQEWLGNTKVDKEEVGLYWNQLMRSGSSPLRIDHPLTFYPIVVNAEGTKILRIGECLEPGVDRNTVPEEEGTKNIWPIRSNGEEGRWQLGREKLEYAIKHGYVRLGKFTKNGMAITYLAQGEQNKVEKGVFNIKGHRKDGAIIEEKIVQSHVYVPGSQWNIQSHNATYFGTQLLNKFIGNRFSYPKSLYAVHDTIRFFVANKPNALILDFFAGSGTTLHAVNLLNAEDGGNRRCIMVTNNEVSADEETEFRANGFHKGDEEWEKFGIARYVNWPRTKCSIEGVNVDGQPINGEYITSNTQEITQARAIKQLSFVIPEGAQGVKVKKQIVALINDKKMPQNSVTTDCPYIVKDDANNAVLFDLSSIDEFFEEIHEDIETIYVVSTDNKAFKDAKHILDELPERKKSVPVKIPMSAGFEANAAFYRLTFLDKEAVSIGTQLDKMLSILWMKAGAHGVCPVHVEGEYKVFSENKMAILIDEYAIDELKEELSKHPEIETVYIIDDSENNYRALAAQINVKNTYQLYRDYLDNFKINIERR